MASSHSPGRRRETKPAPKQFVHLSTTYHHTLTLMAECRSSSTVAAMSRMLADVSVNFAVPDDDRVAGGWHARVMQPEKRSLRMKVQPKQRPLQKMLSYSWNWHHRCLCEVVCGLVASERDVRQTFPASTESCCYQPVAHGEKRIMLHIGPCLLLPRMRHYWNIVSAHYFTLII